MMCDMTSRNSVAVAHMMVIVPGPARQPLLLFLMMMDLRCCPCAGCASNTCSMTQGVSRQRNCIWSPGRGQSGSKRGCGEFQGYPCLWAVSSVKLDRYQVA